MHRNKKIIRDPVHEYINLSPFQLKLIDTPEFQRLKDVRQLTCQHVYPSARHTRFEHSLGVMELTQQAIKQLTSKGLIGQEVRKDLISDELTFLAVTAALLHDVGHSAFSHMGEVETDKNEVRTALKSELKKHNIALNFSGHKTKHEQLSCIVILRKFSDCLKDAKEFAGKKYALNIEFVLRCILGVNYSDDSTAETKIRNLLIGLINSASFDMDKLDYIMRDSYATAIGAPQIDTKRLFRNMYIADISGEYKTVFTSKAVPALQNLIDARDNLYIWVYNHHTVVYSDFIYSYIFRRLSRNAEDDTGGKEKFGEGKIPREHFFSVDAVVERRVSDSDIQSALNKQGLYYDEEKKKEAAINEPKPSLGNEAKKVKRALELIDKLARRDFLTPWWKTVYEYKAFMEHYFRDNNTREKVAERICDEKKYSEGFCSEFRSQIAKGTIELSEGIVESEEFRDLQLSALQDGDFFVVQRSNKFFGKNTIEEFNVYLHENEIVGRYDHSAPSIGSYYSKNLTELLPYKNYDTMFDKNGFYVYMLKASSSKTEEKINFYRQMERVFAYVATRLAQMSELDFICAYGDKELLEEYSKDHIEKSAIKSDPDRRIVWRAQDVQ